jgi:transposase
VTTTGYTTRGRRSGACGHVHPDRSDAQACLDVFRAGCELRGVPCDRKVVPWRPKGRKPQGDCTRDAQVLVRLTADEIQALDQIRGDLSRAGWCHAVLAPALRART